MPNSKNIKNKNDEKRNELEANIAQVSSRVENNDFLGASVYAGQALKLAIDLGEKDAMVALKNQLIEYNKKAEYQEHEFSIELPTEEIKKTISLFTEEKDGIVSLYKIARSREFMPNAVTLEKTAQDTMPLTADITTEHVVDNDGNTIAVDDAREHWKWTIYEFDQNLKTRMLSVIFSRLTREGKIDEKLVYGFFARNSVFNESERAKLKIGIERYFAEDYISALHILVVTYEGIFIRLCGLFGIDVVALSRGRPTTGLRIMSQDLLQSEDCQKVWSQDLCRQVEFVMLSIYGYKLRHRVAHGQIDIKECNHASTTLVLSMLMRLAGNLIPTNPYGSIQEYLDQKDKTAAEH